MRGERVVNELTKPWDVTGATVLRLSPGDFLRRLAMLIPPPYQNLIHAPAEEGALSAGNGQSRLASTFALLPSRERAEIVRAKAREGFCGGVLDVRRAQNPPSNAGSRDFGRS